jgi:hypothetical protein
MVRAPGSRRLDPDVFQGVFVDNRIVLRIDTPEAATRLARALISDVRLYHSARIERGEDLTDALQEGRELFRSRVEASLHVVYERVVAEARFPAPDGTLAPVERHGSGEPLPTGLFQGDANEARAPRNTVAILFVVLVLAMGLGFWLATR